jgi:type II secretory pathway component PulM
MNKYFSQLRPMERRLVVAAAVVVFLVLNAVFIWPHYSDWSSLRGRLDDAQRKLKLYQTAVDQTAAYEAQVKKFASQGESVAAEDQAINFTRTIQSQSIASGVQLQNTSRQITRTNDAFFVEQVQNISVLATEEQLVNFLYNLGSGASMIRVRDLELQPDAPRQRLSASIKLVASYQKNSPSAKAPSTAKAP